MAEAARSLEIVIEARALLPQHAARRGDGPRHLHRRLVLGDVDRVARLEDDVGPGGAVAQRPLQIDVDPPHRALATIEPDALGVRLPRQPTGPLDQTGEPIVLALEGVRPGIVHLALDRHRALQLEVGLPQDQHVVVRRERYLGRRAGGRERKARRPRIAPR